MSLSEIQWQWLNTFSGGAIDIPVAHRPEAGSAKELEALLRIAKGREEADERALKDVLISAATARLEKKKEEMRKAFQIDVVVKDKKGPINTTKNLKTRDEDGRQERAFDTVAEGHKLVSVGKDDPQSAQTPKKVNLGEEDDDTVFGANQSVENATNMMAFAVDETSALEKVMTARSHINLKTKTIEKLQERLFTDIEISDEIYTPMVREKIIGENFVPNKYSQTQRVLDGSNDYYITECKEKGKQLGVGGAAISKAAITAASALTVTALQVVAPVSSTSALGSIAGLPMVHQEGLAGGTQLSKEASAHAQAITQGIAALLTAGVDIADQIDDHRTSGNFSVSGFKVVANGLGLVAGRLVAGITGNNGTGNVVTDSIAGAVATVDIGLHVGKWMKNKDKGAEFPWKELCAEIGGAIAAGLSAGSDKTSGDLSTHLAQGASGAAIVFNTAAAAFEKNALTSIRNGDWKAVFSILATAGEEAIKQVPMMAHGAESYNSKDNMFDQLKATKYAADDQAALEKGTADLDKLGTALLKTSGDKLPSGPSTAGGRRQAELDAFFKKKKDALDKKVETDELAAIEKRLEAEQKEYQTSLSCLGSTNMDDSKYKSIAKLIAQIERDRAIWTAITTIAQAPFVIAAEFVPALKAGGELAKFVANIKAAADRLEALLNWNEASKDAESAVSPYATSVKNMIKNQAEQFSHYSVQAAFNAIKALVAVGELTPYAPAFKIAGAALGAGASAADLTFKVYQQAELHRAWKTTKKAIADPKNRKLGLIAREMNPTLAKYTLAYGALIENDQVALTAMDRIGLDRETLSRPDSKVREVKDFMQKLYKDDNVVLGQLDAVKGKSKMPPAALEPKAWALTHQILAKDYKLPGESPPAIIAGLKLVSELEQVGQDKLTDEQYQTYSDALATLLKAFASLPRKDEGGIIVLAAGKTAALYADLVEARKAVLDINYGAAKAKAQEADLRQKEEAAVAAFAKAEPHGDAPEDEAVILQPEPSPVAKPEKEGDQPPSGHAPEVNRPRKVKNLAPKKPSENAPKIIRRPSPPQ